MSVDKILGMIKEYVKYSYLNLENNEKIKFYNNFIDDNRYEFHSGFFNIQKIDRYFLNLQLRQQINFLNLNNDEYYLDLTNKKKLTKNNYKSITKYGNINSYFIFLGRTKIFYKFKFNNISISKYLNNNEKTLYKFLYNIKRLSSSYNSIMITKNKFIFIYKN